MVLNPGATPVTIPVVEPTRAMFEFVAVQVPPGIELVRVIGVEVHTELGPAVAAKGYTVNVVVAVQPVRFTTNDMVAVPAETPVTAAVVEPTVAIVGSLLLHIPLPTSVSDVVDP